MNWKELFSSRILDRGFDYYLCNAKSSGGFREVFETG